MSLKSLPRSNKIFQAILLVGLASFFLTGLVATESMISISTQVDVTRSLIVSNSLEVASIRQQLLDLTQDVKEIKADVALVKEDINSLKVSNYVRHY